MSRRRAGHRARDVARLARALAAGPMTRAELSAALGARQDTLRGYLVALRAAGAVLGLDDRRRYHLLMPPAEIVTLLEAIAAPKTQATSRACEKSTDPPK